MLELQETSHWLPGFTACSCSHGCRCCTQDIDEGQATFADSIQQKRGKHRVAVSPSIDLKRFYHARTCIQMTKIEVEGILVDPQTAPDSDDEEDVEDWKVCITQ